MKGLPVGRHSLFLEKREEVRVEGDLVPGDVPGDVDLRSVCDAVTKDLLCLASSIVRTIGR
jgi:hypothetical protein